MTPADGQDRVVAGRLGTAGPELVGTGLGIGRDDTLELGLQLPDFGRREQRGTTT